MITAVASKSLPPTEALRAAPVAVSVRHVSKRFLARRPLREMVRHPFKREYNCALNDVSVDILAGEFFGFLGANGAGKTTLFKILATLVTPDEGSIAINGLDLVQHAPDVRRILTPVIADERSLRWRLSARENLQLYAVLYNVPSHNVNKRVDEVLDNVGLNARDPKMVGRFSSGMRQRLLIARALIPRPRILLLDEPTRSLDPVSARGLREFIRENLCRALGCTVILATHTTEEAFDYCDRVAILDRGRPVAIGETEKLALRFGEERYMLWTQTPGHAALDSLMARGLATAVIPRGCDLEGWAKVELEIPGGLDCSARTLEYLTERGVSVARFEHIGLSLGELIQRVTAQAAGGSGA